MARKTDRYDWNAEDFTISDQVDLPTGLKKIVSDAPEGDGAKGRYLQGLVSQGKLTPDDILFLFESGVLT